MAAPRQPLKCLIVGEEGSGKTTLMVHYLSREPPTKYTPEGCEPAIQGISVDNESMTIQVFDSSVAVSFAYPNPYIKSPHYFVGVDVALLIFSVAKRKSLERAKDYWADLVDQFSPEIPRILVGNKVDLRANPPTYNDDIISQQEGQEAAETLRCVAYVELQANSKDQLPAIEKLFTDAARFAKFGPIYPPRTKKEGGQEDCALM